VLLRGGKKTNGRCRGFETEFTLKRHIVFSLHFLESAYIFKDCISYFMNAYLCYFHFLCLFMRDLS